LIFSNGPVVPGLTRKRKMEKPRETEAEKGRENNFIMAKRFVVVYLLSGGSVVGCPTFR